MLQEEPLQPLALEPLTEEEQVGLGPARLRQMGLGWWEEEPGLGGWGLTE